MWINKQTLNEWMLIIWIWNVYLMGANKIIDVNILISKNDFRFPFFRFNFFFCFVLFRLIIVFPVFIPKTMRSLWELTPISFQMLHMVELSIPKYWVCLFFFIFIYFSFIDFIDKLPDLSETEISSDSCNEVHLNVENECVYCMVWYSIIYVKHQQKHIDHC